MTLEETHSRQIVPNYKEKLGGGLTRDHIVGWDRAHDRRWWQFWKPRTFGCKSYRVMLVGHNDALANRLCINNTIIRSSIVQDPDHIDQVVFAQAVKMGSAHISSVKFVPGHAEYTLTIFGSEISPRK